jgi:hypothetical protein
MSPAKWGTTMLLAALPLAANTIDVSTSALAVLHPGDTLSFEISDRSFAANAARYGQPSAPTAISMQFVSTPGIRDARLAATLESQDGSVFVAFGNLLADLPGTFSGAGYQGPVTSFRGSIGLSQAQSQEIFSGSSALLVLQNRGTDDLTLGLPPYTLRQDLYLTLLAGSMSAGATQLGVQLDTEPVPEPHPGPLLLAGGLLLCAIATVWKRLGRDKQAPASLAP